MLHEDPFLQKYYFLQLISYDILTHYTSATSQTHIAYIKKYVFQSKDEIEECSTNDVRNAEPSVKEASSRFGVNLRRWGTKVDASEQTSPPEESPPPPPPPPLSPSPQELIDASFDMKPGMKEMLELKLVNEIKQSCEMKSAKRMSGIGNNAPSGQALDPASQLLSELCATFTIESGTQF